MYALPASEEYCEVPKLSNNSTLLSSKYRSIVYPLEKDCEDSDEAWALLQAMDDSKSVPTYKAFNIKIINVVSELTKIAMLPLTKSPPTEWSPCFKAMPEYFCNFNSW